MFSTFIGFQAGYKYGNENYGYAFLEAMIITLAVFTPCFLLSVWGHSILQKLVRNKFFSAFFDGITGSVVGLIAITALDLLRASITTETILNNVPESEKAMVAASHDSIAGVVYVIALIALYSFKTPYLAFLLVIFGAIAGQFLFII